MSWKLSGEEQRFAFRGAYDNYVELVIYPRQIASAGHVVVLPIYDEKFVFTRHKSRGIEWPGGKIETGEQPLEAALRELEEETGAKAQSVWLIGQYSVRGQHDAFIKNVYVAQVSTMGDATGDDTNGAILLPMDTLPDETKGYSPIVSDGVFKRIRDAIFGC
ncbi:NUDIX domain-containing protein [Caldalkalibacillus salinus]|uniref:NUDIX domain-containing protein n=1 Tax=Caldalkalibacillus salinus TaxID=2803787 RepID=UPI0019224979|nr:NUDIX domain-containing protein [Caldalkalibacillus salinus]